MTSTLAQYTFRYHTYITIFLAYFCSFGIILLAPTDVALTVLGRREIYDPLRETNYEKYNDEVSMCVGDFLRITRLTPLPLLLPSCADSETVQHPFLALYRFGICSNAVPRVLQQGRPFHLRDAIRRYHQAHGKDVLFGGNRRRNLFGFAHRKR